MKCLNKGDFKKKIRKKTLAYHGGGKRLNALEDAVFTFAI